MGILLTNLGEGGSSKNPELSPRPPLLMSGSEVQIYPSVTGIVAIKENKYQHSGVSTDHV